jgi:RimJ/RimL family protein N-acetyltransferase
MNLPPYKNFPTISGENISLRQIMPADIESLIEISCYDAIKATSLIQAIEMQAKIDKDYDAGNSIHWGIADSRTNDLVGTCGYYRGLDKGHGELGCILLPQYRGKGFMTSAMELAIGFGIHNIGLKRVWAITTKQNDNAIKLLTRLNFVKVADLQDDEIEFELR